MNAPACLHKTIHIPGKALLFGEFYLLQGGKGLVLLLPQWRFSCTFKVAVSFVHETHEQKGAFELDFYSDFSGSVLLSQNFWSPILAHHCYFNLSSVLNPHERDPQGKPLFPTMHHRFLAALLLPYVKEIQSRGLSVSLSCKVTESFDPALGLGSSSALLTAFHLFLFEWLFNASPWEAPGTLNQSFWSYVLSSLTLLQGKGSGYDVLCQAHGAWQTADSYALTQGARQAVPTDGGMANDALVWVDPVTRQVLGAGTQFSLLPQAAGARTQCRGALFPFYLARTGCYSNTTQVLREQVLDDSFIQMQKSIFERALNSKNPQDMRSVFRDSKQLMAARGLLGLPPSPSRLRQWLTTPLTSFKTMGAGAGDCLMVEGFPAQWEQEGGDLGDVVWQGALHWPWV